MARDVVLQPGKDLDRDKEMVQGEWSSLNLADFKTATKNKDRNNRIHEFLWSVISHNQFFENYWETFLISLFDFQ